MTDVEELPALNLGLLDGESLRDLFVDIESAAELVSVFVKRAEDQHGEVATESLARLLELIRERQVLGAQVRYRHAGRFWCDTLMVTEAGVRLVRIEQTGS